MKFICGCRSKIDAVLPVTTAIFKTFDAVSIDEQGFLICFVHRERRHGWRSVPYAAMSMVPGADPAWSPQEYERWLYWAEIPKAKVVAVASTPGVPDIRDNRDPQQVGNEYLAAMAIARNGNNLSMDREQSLPPDDGMGFR